MKNGARLLYLTLPAILAACGSSAGMTDSDVQAFRSTALAVSSTAVSYGAAATSMTSTAQCSAMQGAYDGQVRPMVSRMQGMSAAMDDMMGSMNRMADGDMGCAANAMMAELDRHASVACTSSTGVAPDAAEAQQHAAAMQQWAAHEQDRAQEMGSMMGMSGMMGGSGGSTAGAGRCVHNPDGSYTFQP